jgi:hypothetical protein
MNLCGFEMVGCVFFIFGNKLSWSRQGAAEEHVANMASHAISSEFDFGDS